MHLEFKMVRSRSNRIGTTSDGSHRRGHVRQGIPSSRIPLVGGITSMRAFPRTAAYATVRGSPPPNRPVMPSGPPRSCRRACSTPRTSGRSRRPSRGGSRRTSDPNPPPVTGAVLILHGLRVTCIPHSPEPSSVLTCTVRRRHRGSGIADAREIEFREN